MPNVTPVLEAANIKRKRIRDSAIQGLKSLFPVETSKLLIDAVNYSVKEGTFSISAQKKAILTGRSLYEHIYADLVVKDKETGKILDTTKKFRLVNVPYLTSRYTFISGGNEYSMNNQLRMKPGIYTRKKANEVLETKFNLGKGLNFVLEMNPEKGILYIVPAGTLKKIPLFPILKYLGVSDGEITAAWGTGLVVQNRLPLDKAEKALKALHSAFIYKGDPASDEATKVSEIKDYFTTTQLDPEVTHKTLGVKFSKVDAKAMLIASKKLLEAAKSEGDMDDRDSLEFKTLHSSEDFIRERLEKQGKSIVQKIKYKYEKAYFIGDRDKKLEAGSVLQQGMFTGVIDTLINSSNLTANLDGVNPIEITDAAYKVTPMGEGGIGSDLGIPMETRSMHNSQLGIIDPVRTPESRLAGVDLRLAVGARRDEKGNLYAPVRNVKTNKVEYLSPKQSFDKYVALPGQDLKKMQTVEVMYRNKIESVPRSRVQYQIAMTAALFSPTTNLVPFVDGVQGNRNVMASKMTTQALSLVKREAPLVQIGLGVDTPIKGKGGIVDITADSMEQVQGKIILPKSPVSGKVVSVTNDIISIKDNSGKISKVEYSDYFPTSKKAFIHDTPIVKKGDTVKKDQILATSNFTDKDGTLALGTNLKVGYLPYYGINHEDGVVISEHAAEKLISQHMSKVIHPVDSNSVIKKSSFTSYFPTAFTAEQVRNITADGVATEGTVLEKGDPIILALRKIEITAEAAMLGKLHRSLLRNYTDDSMDWDHEYKGEIKSVTRTPSKITVVIESFQNIQEGDKLSGRYGNKGVVAKIVPDVDMLKDAGGEPIDIVFTPAGVVSRINPGQIIETAVSKVAKKTGKPVIVPAFGGVDKVQWAKDLLKKNGIKDKEDIYDPISRKKIPNVAVGNQYIYKLFKQVDEGFSAHGAMQGYNANEQPVKGNLTGSKSIGGMEVNALLAHNSRALLREFKSVKSQKNDDYWTTLQLGGIVPPPKTTFSYNKFLNMTRAAGIKVDERKEELAFGPLTDKDILEMSSGRVDNSKRLKSKNLEPEIGGLFDPAVTGGSQGDKWSHLDLPEPMVNPVFEEPVYRLLDMKKDEFEALLLKEGASSIQEKLKGIDIDKELEALEKKLKTAKGSIANVTLKKIKYLNALKDNKLTPDKAYILTKFPIIPPNMRPIGVTKSGDVTPNPVNDLYRDVIESANNLKENKKLVGDEGLSGLRKGLYDSLKSVTGIIKPASKELANNDAKGFLQIISGDKPKTGFFQDKVIKSTADVSGRAVVSPDVDLGLEEVGLPEDMGWGMYEPFLIKELIKRGNTAFRSKEMVKERHPLAKALLDIEVKKRPVIINRAPSLWRHNLLAAYPKLVSGRTLKVNPFIEAGMNMDYDGDAANVHVPISDEAIEESKGLTLKNQLFADRSRNDLLVFPRQEPIIGLYLSSIPKKNAKVVARFNSIKDAKLAYKKGEIEFNDLIDIRGIR